MARCGDPTGQRPLHWRRHPCNNPGSGGARRQSRPSRGEAGGWSTIRTSARKQDGPAGYRKRQQSNNEGGDFHDTSSPAVNVLQTSPFPAFLGAHLRGGVSISAVCGAPTTDSLAHPKRAITFLRAGGSAYSPRNLGIDAAPGHHAHRKPSTQVLRRTLGEKIAVERPQTSKYSPGTLRDLACWPSRPRGESECARCAGMEKVTSG
jgi:hypothetical protein